MPTTARRYSITLANQMGNEIAQWIEQTEESIATEESKDYPNDERLDMLQQRIDCLQTALDALGDLP